MVVFPDSFNVARRVLLPCGPPILQPPTTVAVALYIGYNGGTGRFSDSDGVFATNFHSFRGHITNVGHNRGSKH